MRTDLKKKIRIRMVVKEITAGDIARSCGVTRSAINKTIEGKINSYRLREAIAKAIGVAVEKLWPNKVGLKQ